MIDDADPTRAALEALIDAAGEAKAREILTEIARPATLAEFERLAAFRFALQLREAREPRYVIRDRLVARGLSRATSYRIAARVIEVTTDNCLSDDGTVRREPATVSPPADAAANFDPTDWKNP